MSIFEINLRGRSIGTLPPSDDDGCLPSRGTLRVVQFPSKMVIWLVFCVPLRALEMIWDPFLYDSSLQTAFVYLSK